MELTVLERAIESLERWSSAWNTGAPDDSFESDAVLMLVKRLHRFNWDLWLQEDIARRTDVPDAVIRRVKHAIDRLNQERNDAVEALDQWLIVNCYLRTQERASTVVRTETPGSVFDRLSILALKILRMGEQTRRSDATPEHAGQCARRLDVLLEQRDDLRTAFRLLVAELNAGTVRMRVYRQFKMYNDPTLNPQLYNAAATIGGMPAAARRGAAV